ncbi:hypothetical protein [Rhodococcus marinonascens]|uniref:hypothetical protein n=1 Tax=Rhodococcus marinonascens TaxID=38311 RepID=UPI0009335A32|nr:hypothetical protein [Rhodococcus marinonascens]
MRKTGIGIAAVTSLALLTGGIAHAQDAEVPTIPAGDGQYTVGTGDGEIAPGIYHTVGGEGCNWTRIGADEAELAKGETPTSDVAAAVIIEATFTTAGDCGEWTMVAEVPTP